MNTELSIDQRLTLILVLSIGYSSKSYILVIKYEVSSKLKP